MSDRRQVCIIGGGRTYYSHNEFRIWLKELDLDYDRLFYGTDWKSWLAQQLTDFDVLQPQMPNKLEADFQDWSTYFFKVEAFLSPEAILIGHSLGAIFLAKYLSSGSVKKYRQIILVAPPYDDEAKESLASFKVESSVSALADVSDKIDLIFSRDDPVVDFAEVVKYRRDLPNARVHVFDDHGHFNQPEFLELLDIIG